LLLISEFLHIFAYKADGLYSIFLGSSLPTFRLLYLFRVVLPDPSVVQTLAKTLNSIFMNI